MSIEAMKLALEALEKALDAIESWGSYASEYFQVKHDLEGDIENTKASITALRQAIEQSTEQEPVAWYFKGLTHHGGLMRHGVSLHKENSDWQPLYTTPPPPHPLTDEEMKAIWYDMKNIMGWYSFQEIARAIEEAHGIKENT